MVTLDCVTDTLNGTPIEVSPASQGFQIVRATTSAPGLGIPCLRFDWILVVC